jgi:hypothetical protein
MLTLARGSQDDMDEETKREHQGKRVVVDKETGKAKEVDIYDRSAASKKKDPEKLKAIFSSNLEQSIMPSSISNAFPLMSRAQPRVAGRGVRSGVRVWLPRI